MKLSAAASSRATLDAETMGRLASEEFWDDTAGPAPRAPRGGRARRSPGRLRHERWRGERAPRRVRTRRDGARAPVSEPAEKRASRESLARVAMHALCFETCARGGVMATVRARDSIRALGPRRVVTARGCRGDYVGSGTDVGSRTDSGLATSDAAVDSSDAAVDSPRRPSTRPSTRTRRASWFWKRRTFARV